MAREVMEGMRNMVERYFSVSIETWGMGIDSVDPDALFDLVEALELLDAKGPSASIGGLAGGVGATFGVLSFGGDEEVFADVVTRASQIFIDACRKADVLQGGIARLDVLSEEYLAKDLEQPAETYAGVSELAQIFGVSRQRMSELRTRADFPAPVAELKAGPVWAVSSLTRFLSEWERKPGRPRKDVTIQVPTATAVASAVAADPVKAGKKLKARSPKGSKKSGAVSTRT